MIETQKYIRKPLIVSAVRVTQANFNELASWCQGEIQQDEPSAQGPGRQYIQVRVHNPKNLWQTKAYVGDWLLYTERGYKIYKNKAFHASFEPMTKDNTPIVAEKPGVAPEHIQPREASATMTEDEEVIEFTAENIAQVAKDNERARKLEEAANGKRILSVAEQKQMSANDVRDLIAAGEAILEQDLAV